MVRAAPSGLRFWLTVDHRINGSSSVYGVCEVYYISTRCEPLYPKCNRIFSNKTWMWRHLCRCIDGSAILFWLSRDPYDPDDQRFDHASRRKLCGIERHFDKITWVCDKLSISNYSKTPHQRPPRGRPPRLNGHFFWHRFIFFVNFM